MKKIYLVFVLLCAKAYGFIDVDTKPVTLPSDIIFDSLTKISDIKEFESVLRGLFLTNKELYSRLQNPKIWKWVKNKSFMSGLNNKEIFSEAVYNNCDMIVNFLSCEGYRLDNFILEDDSPEVDLFIEATSGDSLLLIKLLSKIGYTLDDFLEDSGRDKVFFAYYAIATDNLLLIKLLVDSGFDINQELENLNSLKSEALDFDLGLRIRLIVDIDLDSLYENFENISPLILSIRHKSTKVSEFLIKNKINLEMKDDFGCTALMHAIEENQIDIVRLLIDQGVEYDYFDNCPLYKHWMGLSSIIDYGTVEHWKSIAKVFDHVEYIKAFESVIGKIKVNSKGYTCLMVATLFGNTEIVKILIHAGANVNLRNKYQESAISLAIKSDNLPIVGLLLNCKSIECEFDNIADSVINSCDLCIKDRINILFKLFRDNKISNINIRDNLGYSLLMLAVKAENELMVKYLLNKGADVLYEVNGDSALDMAVCLRLDSISSLFFK